MFDPLGGSVRIAASGLDAQAARIRTLTENMANANSTGNAPGADPYRRKVIAFQSVVDEELGGESVKVSSIGGSRAPFRREYDVSHPAADAQGFVKYPNVNVLVEMADMREAGRAYEANLQVIKQARELVSMTLDLLRS